MYRSPSRGETGCFLNSSRLRDGFRSLNRKRKRRGRSESGSEVLLNRVEVRTWVPKVLRDFAFGRGRNRQRVARFAVGRCHSLKTGLIEFLRPPYSLKVRPASVSRASPFKGSVQTVVLGQRVLTPTFHFFRI